MTQTKEHRQKKVTRLLYLGFLVIQLGFALFFFVKVSQVNFFFHHVEQNVKIQDELLEKFRPSIEKDLFLSLTQHNKGIKEYSILGSDIAEVLVNTLLFYTLIITGFTFFFIVKTLGRWRAAEEST